MLRHRLCHDYTHCQLVVILHTEHKEFHPTARLHLRLLGCCAGLHEQCLYQHSAVTPEEADTLRRCAPSILPENYVLVGDALPPEMAFCSPLGEWMHTEEITMLTQTCEGPSSIHAHTLNRSALDAGNYDTYLQVRSELEDAQMKKHKWEQDQISHMKVHFSLPRSPSRPCHPGMHWQPTQTCLAGVCVREGLHQPLQQSQQSHAVAAWLRNIIGGEKFR